MIDQAVFIIDIEASGIQERSFPIEIAWSSLDGRSAGSALIRPETEWELGTWDGPAEAVHGISLDQLMRNGEPADQVAARFLHTVAGGELFSDARLHDTAWLRMLTDALWPPESAPKVRDIRELIHEIRRDRFETLLTARIDSTALCLTSNYSGRSSGSVGWPDPRGFRACWDLKRSSVTVQPCS